MTNKEIYKEELAKIYMRILKGYSKDEQKELENAKKHMSCNGLLCIITGNRATAEYCFIKDKYYKVKEDEQISIIRDILDFYTDKAMFAEPKKYYVHLIKDDSFSYFNLGLNGEKTYIGGNPQTCNFQTQFTKQEVEDINPNYIPFLEKVPVEESE